MKLLLFAAAGVAAGGFVLQGSGNSLLDGHVAALSGAQSLTLTISSQTIPGVPTEYKISYSKPNLFRIESAQRLIVSDGKTLFDLDKTSNLYSESPVGEGLPGTLLEDDFWAWAPFFTSEPLKTIQGVQTGRKRKVGGVDITEVVFKMQGLSPKTGTLMIDPATGFAKGLNVKIEDTSGSMQLLIIASQAQLGADVLPKETFAFTAPAGAKKAEAAEGAVTYANVASILRSNCARCHGGGRMNLRTYAGVMAGSNGNKIVIPGDPENSLLIQYVTGVRQPKMPLGGSLSQAQIDLLKKWIKEGAKEK